MELVKTRNTTHCVLARHCTLENYSIDAELGCGRFAKVWSAMDSDSSMVAIKIYRDITRDFKYYKNEIMILNRIANYAMINEQDIPYIISYIRTFAHVSFDNVGCPKIHPCIVFNLGGETVSKLVKYYRKKYETGLPMNSVKKIMRSVLKGLDFLHTSGIIHTDIKPGNILLNCTADMCEEVGSDKNPPFEIMIADLGSATLADDIFSDTVGTLDYMAPELIIDAPFDTSIDIWAAFTMCYKLITSDILFDIFAETDIMYGEDVDCEALEGLIDGIDIHDETDENSLNDIVVESEEKHGGCLDDCDDNCSNIPQIDILINKECSKKTNNTDDSNGSASSDSEDDLDPEKISYRHLLLINKLLGHPSPEFTRNARTYYNHRDRLKNNPDIVPISVCTLLHANYDFELPQCEEIEAFLLCGLKYMPDERCTANEALKHSFLAD